MALRSSQRVGPGGAGDLPPYDGRVASVTLDTGGGRYELGTPRQPRAGRLSMSHAGAAVAGGRQGVEEVDGARAVQRSVRQEWHGPRGACASHVFCRAGRARPRRGAATSRARRRDREPAGTGAVERRGREPKADPPKRRRASSARAGARPCRTLAREQGRRRHEAERRRPGGGASARAGGGA